MDWPSGGVFEGMTGKMAYSTHPGMFPLRSRVHPLLFMVEPGSLN